MPSQVVESSKSSYDKGSLDWGGRSDLDQYGLVTWGSELELNSHCTPR